MFAESLYGQSLVIARICFKIQWVFQSYVMSPLRIAFRKICIFEPGCQQRRRSCCWSSWCVSAFQMLSWGLCKLTWVILLWKQRDWRVGEVVQGPKICTGILIQASLKLVSLFGFENANLVAPCIAWAALLGETWMLSLIWRAVLHSTGPHPALPSEHSVPPGCYTSEDQHCILAPAACSAASLLGEAHVGQRKFGSPSLPLLLRFMFLPKGFFPTWMAARLTSNTTPSKNPAVQTEKGSALWWTL